MLRLVAMADGDMRGGRRCPAEDVIADMRTMIAYAKADKQ